MRSPGLHACLLILVSVLLGVLLFQNAHTQTNEDKRGKGSGVAHLLSLALSAATNTGSVKQSPAGYAGDGSGGGAASSKGVS